MEIKAVNENPEAVFLEAEARCRSQGKKGLLHHICTYFCTCLNPYYYCFFFILGAKVQK